MGSYTDNTEILVRGESGSITVSNIPEQPQQSIAPRDDNTGKIDVQTQPEMTPDKKSEGYDPPVSPVTPAMREDDGLHIQTGQEADTNPKRLPKSDKHAKTVEKSCQQYRHFDDAKSAIQLDAQCA